MLYKWDALVTPARSNYLDISWNPSTNTWTLAYETEELQDQLKKPRNAKSGIAIQLCNA